MINFLKGIVAGIGGVAPGVSGSVLLMIFGLYQKTIDAVGTLFKNLKRNIAFLLPLLAGMGVGVLLFSKVLYYFLENFSMHTRYAFLGMILGTIPMFCKEMTKKGFSKRYYLVITVAAICGLCAFTLNSDFFPKIDEPTVFQSVFMGVAIASTAIIPGNDPAALLSTFGMYESYTRALAEFDIFVLVPFAVGFVIGAIVLSFIMSRLLKKAYTLTFSVVFGIFLSMIPNMLDESCVLGFNRQSVIAILIVILGFALTFYLSDFVNNNRRIKRLFEKLKSKKITNCN